jgi:hypothetical protein
MYFATRCSSAQACCSATLPAGVRVRDAVRLDGNDSVLMGHHDTLHYGDDMPAPKRACNKYGYDFLEE